MNRKVKIALNIVLVLALVGYATFASVFYNDNEKRCQKFEVIINDSNIKFVNSIAITEMIDSVGLNPVGKLRGNINIFELENIIKSNIYIDSAEVYTDLNGNCFASITQRKPIIRVNTVDGYDFYLTQDLVVLPPQPKRIHNIAVVNGEMKFDFDKKFFGKVEKKDGQLECNLKKLLNFVQFVSKDDFLSNLVVQIWVDKDWRVDLVPNVGDQVIRVGDMDNVQDKLNKLSKFYKSRFNDGWWAFCSEVNVEYKNQIIIR